MYMCCVDICMYMYVRESDDICVCVTLYCHRLDTIEYSKDY